MTKFIVNEDGNYLGEQEDTYTLQVGERDTQVPIQDAMYIMRWLDDDWHYMYGVDIDNNYMGMQPTGVPNEAALLVSVRPPVTRDMDVYNYGWISAENRWGLKPEFVASRNIQARKVRHRTNTEILRSYDRDMGDIRIDKLLFKKCYSVFSSAVEVSEAFAEIRRVFPEFVEAHDITDFSYISIGGDTPHLISLTVILQSGLGRISSALGHTYFFNTDNATYYKETRENIGTETFHLSTLDSAIEQNICGTLTSETTTVDNYGNNLADILEVIITPANIDDVIKLNAWIVGEGVLCGSYNFLRKEIAIITINKTTKEVLQLRHVSFDNAFIMRDPAYSGESLRARSIVREDDNFQSDNANWKG